MSNSENCVPSIKAKNIFEANGYAAIIIKNNSTKI
jgi:hypothetical protein